MAFADFQERSRQSVAQIIKGLDGTALDARLAAIGVSVAFDGSATRSREARASLDLSVRLLARLYPSLGIVAMSTGRAFAGELAAIARAINPAIDLRERCDGPTIVVGRTTPETGRPIYLGSTGWLAKVGTRSPIGSGNSGNPFGAGAAACIAVANIFRMAFGDWLPSAALDDELVLSLLDFSTGMDAGNTELPSIDLGRLQMVGLGAIGNGALWALGRLEHLTGTLDVIDHETVDLSNLQRYALAVRGDVDRPKVDLAVDALAGTGLNVRAHATTFRGFAANTEHLALERVAVALDTARDRIEVQASLPRWLVNSWTQSGDLGISRHRFLGRDACLACLYLPRGGVRNEDEIVAGELGFADEERRLRVRHMLHSGQPVDPMFAAEIATALGIPADLLMPFTGLPLRAFRAKAICGNVLIKAGDGGGADVEVPLAFQSALAGVMLASEMIVECGGLRTASLPARTVVDVTKRIGKRLNQAALKDERGSTRCICLDEDYQNAYRAKFGISPT